MRGRILKKDYWERLTRDVYVEMMFGGIYFIIGLGLASLQKSRKAKSWRGGLSLLDSLRKHSLTADSHITI